MYQQINFTEIFLLALCISSISTNKVALEPRDYLIAHLPNVDSKLVVVHIYKTAQHT